MALRPIQCEHLIALSLLQRNIIFCAAPKIFLITRSLIFVREHNTNILFSQEIGNVAQHGPIPKKAQ